MSVELDLIMGYVHIYAFDGFGKSSRMDGGLDGRKGGKKKR